MKTKQREIILTVILTAVLSIIIIPLMLILPRSCTWNAPVIIANDYSIIKYNGEIYIPIQSEMIPKELDFFSNNNSIKATVEGENYFLDKFFLTNLIYVKNYNGYTFLYLNTDYDINESDYYCQKSYIDNLVNQNNS